MLHPALSRAHGSCNLSKFAFFMNFGFADKLKSKLKQEVEFTLFCCQDPSPKMVSLSIKFSGETHILFFYRRCFNEPPEGRE